jgi:hypothetical protein
MSLLRRLRVWRSLLGGGVVRLHPSERLFHFAEDPNRVGRIGTKFCWNTSMPSAAATLAGLAICSRTTSTAPSIH